MKKKKGVSAKRAIFTSFVVDSIDIIMNFTAAIITGSIVMVAETLQGFTDLTTDVFLILGLKSGELRQGKNNFGRGKAIYFFVFLAALVMIFLTAALTIIMGIIRILRPTAVESIILAYIVLTIAVFTNSYSFSVGCRRILAKESFWNIFKVFKKSDLVATKTTFVGDLVGILSAVFGLITLTLYSLTGNARFDGFGAVIIGLVLFWLSFMLLRNVKEFLIGKSASKEVIKRIKVATLEIPGVRSVLGVKTMYIGLEKILVNLDVHLKNNLNTDKIEKIIDNIQDNIRKKVPKVRHVQVEIETPRKKRKRNN
jgi:cation diffusion facilitator family transporter